MKLSAKAVCALASAFGCWLVACGSDSSPSSPADTGADAATCPVGSEGCPCTSGGACDANLTCASKLCVGLPGTDAGDAAAADAADASSTACPSYTASTIAAMRSGLTSGCFELASVVSIARTPGSVRTNLFVQDAAGGDYSAIMATCSATSASHPCSVLPGVTAITDGRSVTLRGEYLRNASTKAELFYISAITDDGAGAPPASAAATLAQVERASTALNLAFQHVTVTISASDTLGMYDWTPSELSISGAAACPFQVGFGMLPRSVAGTATPGCASGSAQPGGQAAPPDSEVLFGTDFAPFAVTSDCRCAKAAAANVPGSTSTLSGQVSGMLVWSVPVGGPGLFYLAPRSVTDAPITNTVAGP